jgi:hypothetical protein
VARVLFEVTPVRTGALWSAWVTSTS